MRPLQVGIAGRVALALVLAMVALVAFRNPLERGLASAILGLATGDRVSIGSLDLGTSRVAVRDLVVERGGDPLFAAERIDARYDLHALLFGGGRRYGLSSLTLLRPRLTVVRHEDGSFNLPLHGTAGPGAPGGASPAGSALAFVATIHDGSVALVDRFRVIPAARELSASGLEVRADVDAARRSTYAGTGRIAGDPGQGFAFAGRIGADGFALHHLRAARVELAPIVNYFINTHSAEVVGGVARDLDVRAYALGRPGEDPAYHLAGSAAIADGAMHVPGLVVDATAMHGRLDAYDGGLAAPRLDARLGKLAVTLAGGLFDWRAPAFRLGLRSSADLSDVRGLFRFSRRLPLAGPVALSTLLEGPVGAPLVATRLDAPALRYGRFPVTGAAGRALYYASEVDVVGARGTYGGLAVNADGAIALGAPEPVTRLVVSARGPAANVPYVAQLAPGATLEADGLLAGTGIRFDARGAVAGTGPGVRVSGLLHVDPDGDGAIGPLAAVRGDGGRLGGTLYLERRRNRSGFWLDARDYPYAAPGGPARLPGIDLAAPAFAGRLDGELAGVGPPSAFRLAGRVRVRGLRAGGVTIDDVTGVVAGAFGNVRLGAVAAGGPWGTFRGSGSYTAGRLALDGRYAGSFERLRAFTGDLGGAGAIAGPVALEIDPARTLVQARDEASGGATVAGVPVDAISGTLSVGAGPPGSRDLRVYAATARVAGGDLSAAGSLAPGSGIGVSLAGADLGRTRAFGGIRSGHASAIGTVSDVRGASRFAGGVAVEGSGISGVPLDANGDVTLGPGRLGFAATDAVAGPAVAALHGSVARFGRRDPVYDVTVRFSDVALASVARLVAPNRRDVAGTVGGDLRVRGAFPELAVAGTLAVPEGTLGGLAFSDASASVAFDRNGLRARGGRVTVGTTRTAFDGSYSGDETALRVTAPHVDLSDFNDLFDAGDTLGGRGRVAFAFAQRGKSTHTDADVAIAALRYRRFDLGDARATWNSRGRSVVGTADFGGPSGTLALAGTLVLPRGAPRDQIVARSRFDGRADLAGLDLGVWLPALGYQVPIDGRVDAHATIAGLLRDPAVSTTATLRDGSIGKFPVDRFSVTATSTFDRTTISALELDLPSVTVAGSGSFGLADRAPVSLAVHARSPNLGALSTRLLGASSPLTGSAGVDLTVDGTRANPRLSGTAFVQAASLHGVAFPQARAAFSVRGRDVVLRDARIDFATGSLALDGSVPFEIAPFALGPAGATVGLTMTASDVELADFAPLLPAGSQLRGRLDGRVAVGGTAGAPRLAGQLTLAGASLQTPLESVPLTNGSAELDFDGNVARLVSLHASAGGGTLDASGSARFADLVRPGSDAAYDFAARAEKLRLDLPAYGSGIVDGTLGFAHLAGGVPRLSGDLRLSESTIPFSALLIASGGGNVLDAVAPAPAVAAPLAFDLAVAADRNVRVRSANVDIGARGSLHVGGTLAAPLLAGGFTSTGGTIAYFNTVFRLVDGTVTFQPDQGLIPTLDARAVTHVIDPDPNTVRNVSGTADVTLSLAGPVTNLTIGLSSDPSYERQQILGLLLNAPALGASTLFGENREQATPYGSNATSNLAPGVAVFRTPTGELSVAQEAFGVANAQFTRTLLAPIETTFAQAVGLSNFNVNVDYTGNVGLSARKGLGRNVNAVYGSTIGYPYRQTFGFEIKPNAVTAAQVTVFETLGANGSNALTPTSFITSSNPKLSATQPSEGTAGFSLSLQRLF